MEEIELPTLEARRWIADAARECGYPDELADFLGYSAWWLENRGMRGVLRTIVYLLTIHGEPFADLEPRNVDGKMVCRCPLMCGLTLVSHIERDPEKFSDWVGGFATADPVLMMPVLARSLDYRSDLFLQFHDVELMFSEKGTAVLSDSILGLFLMNGDGVDAAIRLVEASRNTIPVDSPYSRRDTLQVPAFRYLSGGGFRFD